MRVIRTVFLSGLSLLLSVAPAVGVSTTVRAATESGIPIRVAVLVDRETDLRTKESSLYGSVTHILQWNKISFDTLDIAELRTNTFQVDQSSLRYAALVIVAPAWRISKEGSQYIIEAARRGMGLVGVMADSANEYLGELFGIGRLGREWHDASGVRFVQDKFTFAYQGQTILADTSGLNHQLLPGTEVVGRFVGWDAPAVWTYRWAESKTVFFNSTSTWTKEYQGILLQGILYAMPVGVACPVNAGVIEVDDCPRAFDTAEQVREWYYDYATNLLRWLKAYNLRASFFTSFSYSGNTDDFWRYPESLALANDIVTAGHELGLHCGSRHLPLDIASWGDETAINAEVDRMWQALTQLDKQLRTRYGHGLGNTLSYVAPANMIGYAGYRALVSRTTVRYVGTLHTLAPEFYEGGDYRTDKVYAATFRDFGQEADLGIYNLPRTQGSFIRFSQPQNKDYQREWSNLRATLESGECYLLFTHPEEMYINDHNAVPPATNADVFRGCEIWAQYVTRYYPFYRWWTAAELGQYLENRTGTLDAEWFPRNRTLRVKMTQSDDALHVKTEGNLTSLTREGDYLILTFSSQPAEISTGDYDLVRVGPDYFIYPASSRGSRPVIPAQPFTYIPAEKPAPALETVAPAGAETTETGMDGGSRQNGWVSLLDMTAANLLIALGMLLVVALSKRNRI